MKQQRGIGVSGFCTYEPATLRRARAEAWIAAAGPAASLACSVALFVGAVESGLGMPERGAMTTVLLVGAFCAFVHFVLSALPIRYGSGLGETGEESDGRAIWRILSGAPPGGPSAPAPQPDTAARTPFLAVLAVVFVLTGSDRLDAGRAAPTDLRSRTAGCSTQARGIAARVSV